MTNWIRRAVLIGLPCLFANPLAFCAEKIDLERITPVPDNEPIPTQDFFRSPLFHSPRINPSGTHIAALITGNQDKYQLLCYDLKSRKLDVTGAPGDRDIYQFHWLGDKRLVFSVSAQKTYGMGEYATEVGAFNRVYPLLQYYGATFLSSPVKNRTKPLFWARHDISNSGQDLGVVAVNSDIKTGRLVNLVAASADWSDVVEARDENEKKIIASFPAPKGLSVNYMVDKLGELAFAITHTQGLFTLHRWTGSAWQPCPIDLEKTEIIGAGNQPGELLVLTERQPGKPRALRFMDSATGELGATLIEDQGYDFNGWLFRDPGTHDIAGAIYERNGPTVAWFSEDYRALQKQLDAMFPGVVVRILGCSDSARVFLVCTFSDKQPAAYHWVNLETREAGLVKNSAPWINPKRMQARNVIKYKTRDGFTLDAYLTLPMGASKSNPPPLVVLPHGGPWVRDTWDFDGESQFLASRGYAVLQPNYRGSTGYSWMFPEEDDWAFRKMHDDVTDCVKLVVKSGHVDAKRVAICGGSFGGYLAISGVVNEPNLYRCAVTIAGVFDWATMIRDSKYSQYDNPRYALFRRKLGDPAKEKDKFDAISPLRHIDQVKVPVFVAAGTEDPVVEVGESKRLVAELERYKVPHKTMIVHEEGHGMYRLKNRVELYDRVAAFLEANMK